MNFNLKATTIKVKIDFEMGNFFDDFADFVGEQVKGLNPIDPNTLPGQEIPTITSLAMYAKLFTNSGTLAVLASAIISPIALANEVETFSFQKNIGSVWVGNVTVEQGIISGTSPSASDGYSHWEAEGAKITMNIRTPRCRNQFHTEGSVTVKYTNGEAIITRTIEIRSLQEDTNLTPSWTVRGNYGNPTNGRVNVITNVTCVHHGNRDSAIPNPFGW